MAVPKFKDARLYYRCAFRRHVEANILMKAGQPTGAVYLAGYIVECMLKALNIEAAPANQQQARLERVRRIGHNLTGLYEFYRRNKGSRPPPNVAHAFTLVSEYWTSVIRYDPREVKRKKAEQFLEAVDVIYQWADGRL